MFFLFVFLSVFSLCYAEAGYSGATDQKNHVSGAEDTYSYADGYSGGSAYSGGGGYAGGRGFTGDGSPSVGGAPWGMPFYDFSSLFDQLNRQHQEFIKHGGGAFSYSYASSTPGANAQAQSSITFDSKGTGRIQSIATGQAGTVAGPGSYAQSYPDYQPTSGSHGSTVGSDSAGGFGGSILNRGGFAGGFGGGFSGTDGNSFSFSGPLGDTGTGAALASGSIGPEGGHQVASVYPENPNIPNINTRFASSGGDGGGFKSVFTSSKSVSSNINGVPKNFREAQTTVNDNGKVTTYTARNP